MFVLSSSTSGDISKHHYIHMPITLAGQAPVSGYLSPTSLVAAYENHSRKRPAPVADTFFASWGCPRTRASTVLRFKRKNNLKQQSKIQPTYQPTPRNPYSIHLHMFTTECMCWSMRKKMCSYNCSWSPGNWWRHQCQTFIFLLFLSQPQTSQELFFPNRAVWQTTNKTMSTALTRFETTFYWSALMPTFMKRNACIVTKWMLISCLNKHLDLIGQALKCSQKHCQPCDNLGPLFLQVPLFTWSEVLGRWQLPQSHYNKYVFVVHLDTTWRNAKT